MTIFVEPTIKLITGIFDCKSNNNSYHGDTSAFFRCFFSKKTRTLMPLSSLLEKMWYFPTKDKTFLLLIPRLPPFPPLLKLS